MEFASVNTPVAALVAGLVTSLHCVGMCGPLACMLVPVKGDGSDRVLAAAAYHTGRLLSYGTLGAVTGALGRVPLALLGEGVPRVVPFVLVAFFLGVAFRVDRYLPKPRWVWGLQARAAGWIRGRPASAVAGVTGLLTPLLPCGPLYFLIALAALSGSAAKGAGFLLAFALGTIPLLWLLQANAGWLRARLSPALLARVQTAFALAAALVILWRVRATFGLPGPDPTTFVCF